jgi:hypothetical protein
MPGCRGIGQWFVENRRADAPASGFAEDFGFLFAGKYALEFRHLLLVFPLENEKEFHVWNSGVTVRHGEGGTTEDFSAVGDP